MSMKVAKETFPQKQRKWDKLNQQFPDRSKVIYTTPEGYTINHLSTYGDIARTGLMLHNCWRGHASFSDPSREINPWAKIQRHSLNDQFGHPQVAFFVAPHNGETTVMEALTRNNKPPKPEHEQMLRDYARRHMMGYQVADYENPLLQEDGEEVPFDTDELPETDEFGNRFDAKVGKETPNQERRRWEALNLQHPNTSSILHNFDNGWTVQKLRTRHDVNRTGKFMANCWQGKPVLMPKRLDEDSSYHTLNDPAGMPRAAFYNNKYAPEYGKESLPGYPFMKHNELDKANPTQYPAIEIDQPLGTRDKRLGPEHAEMFKQWAASQGLPVHVKWGGGATHIDHPAVQAAYFSGKGTIFDGAAPIQGQLGEGVPAGRRSNWEQDAYPGKFGEPGNRPAHPFNYDIPTWTPGKKGKGLVSPEGRAYAWETAQEFDGRPSHGEVLGRLGHDFGGEDENSRAAMAKDWSFHTIESDGMFRQLFGPTEHKAIMKAHLPQEPRCADCGVPVRPDQEGEYKCPKCQYWGTYYGDEGWESMFSHVKTSNWVEVPHDQENGWENKEERPIVYNRKDGTVYVGAPGNAHAAIYNHILGPFEMWNNAKAQGYRNLAINHTTGEWNELNDDLSPKEKLYVHGMIQQHLGITPRDPGDWEHQFAKVAEWENTDGQTCSTVK
jgi:hypothetical protein